MHREYIAWDSPALGRRMDLLWFGHGGQPMIWFPTSQGRFYQNETSGSWIGRRPHRARRHPGLLRGQRRRGELLRDEEASGGADPPPRPVRPLPRDRGRSLRAQQGALCGRLATLGCSFGAYHAANFGFRHPELIDKVVGFSGKYDIHSFLDGYWDELCYFHCPTANVPNMDRDWVARLSSMDIAIVTGETDNILSGTTTMLGLLDAKGCGIAALSGTLPSATTGSGGRRRSGATCRRGVAMRAPSAWSASSASA